jgi:hypothetical protein
MLLQNTAHCLSIRTPSHFHRSKEAYLREKQCLTCTMAPANPRRAMMLWSWVGCVASLAVAVGLSVVVVLASIGISEYCFDLGHPEQVLTWCFSLRPVFAISRLNDCSHRYWDRAIGRPRCLRAWWPGKELT